MTNHNGTVGFSKRHLFTSGEALTAASEYSTPGNPVKFTDMEAECIIRPGFRRMQVMSFVTQTGMEMKAKASLLISLDRGTTSPVHEYDNFVNELLDSKATEARKGYGSVDTRIGSAMKSIALVKRNGETHAAPLVRMREGKEGKKTFEGYRVPHYVYNLDREPEAPTRGAFDIRIDPDHYRDLVATGRTTPRYQRLYQYMTVSGMPVLIVCFPPRHNVVTYEGRNFAVLESGGEPFVAVIYGPNLPLIMGLTEYMGDLEATQLEKFYPGVGNYYSDNRLAAVMTATAGQAPRLTSGTDNRTVVAEPSPTTNMGEKLAEMPVFVMPKVGDPIDGGKGNKLHTERTLKDLRRKMKKTHRVVDPDSAESTNEATETPSESSAAQ